jgi:hypothetical protein
MVTEPPDVVKEERTTTRFPISNVHETAGGGRKCLLCDWIAGGGRRRNRESIGLGEGETG